MVTMKRLFAVLWAVAGATALIWAQAQSKFDAVQIKATQVAPNVWMLEGEGGNIGVSVGEDGVLLIDDQYAPLSEKITAAVRKISDKPIRFLVNTHWHGDHTGGNENFGKAGTLIVAHDNVRTRLLTEQATLLGKNPPQPKVALPVITFNDKVTYHINGDTMTAYKVPAAHTDGDVFIRFKSANVVHTGDVFASYRYPYIDTINGGSMAGVLKAVDDLIPTLDDNTKVIPGHGGLSTKKDVIAYREMIATVSSRVEALVKQGKTLAEVRAAKPTADFDERWGKPRSGDAFVEFVYYGYAPYKKQ
jgi:glyoxylase-like metal-dependent hydrolase (beta-lactamase superfamily II)